MRNKGLLILVMLVSLPAAAESAVPGPRARAFVGQVSTLTLNGIKDRFVGKTDLRREIVGFSPVNWDF